MINQQRVQELSESKEKFETYVDAHENRGRDFPKSSLHFHKKTIEMIREDGLHKILCNDVFFDMLYAVLATWGMDNIRGGPKLAEFQEFKSSIKENSSLIEELETFRMFDLDESKKEEVKGKLVFLFKNLKVMKTEVRLVGVSKTLHHLLPDLVPPIDKRYTLKFFYGNGEYNIKNEIQKFEEIFDGFYTICSRLNLTNDDLKKERKWDTSVLKLIDNAIIGYVEVAAKE